MTIEFPNETAPKRGRECPEKASRPKKQTKISNYWLGNSDPSTSDNLNSNRFEIFNTIEQENEHDKIKEKCPKPPPIFIDIYIYIYLARTPEIGQGLGRILSCGARKPEQT